MDSEQILPSIKKMLLIPDSDTVFDQDIIIHINTILANLVQMGVGPENGFTVTGNTELWTDFIAAEDYLKLQQVKTYVFIKVRLLFDPPTSSAIIDAYNRQANELEYRLYTQKGGY